MTPEAIRDLLKRRYACRDYDPNRKISDQDFHLILEAKIPTRTYTYILAFTSLKVKHIKGKFYDWYRYHKNCQIAC